MKNPNPSQRRVLENTSDRLLVSASAGSGKTTVMICKLIGLLRSGESLKNMLVSTFTKASAADIKEKLYDGLYKERSNPHIKLQLEELPFADITNLHSWCQRQITQYFYRLGIDPDFSVVDEAMANTMKEECLVEIIEREAREARPDFVLLYDILLAGRKDNSLKNYVMDIHTFALLQPDPMKYLEGYKNTPDPVHLKSEVEKIAAQKKSDLLGRLLVLEEATINAGFVRNLEYIAELSDYINGLVTTLSTPKGSVSGYEDLNDAFARLKEEARKFVDWQNELSQMDYSAKIDQNAAVLCRMSKNLFQLYAAVKQEKSLLDFSDLEHYMLRLLEDEDVLLELRQKYKFIFVDEYQDINPLQEAILNAICKDSKVFYVGDIKQSIYAFRGCEPQIFLDKYHRYQHQGSIASDQKYKSTMDEAEQKKLALEGAWHDKTTNFSYDQAKVEKDKTTLSSYAQDEEGKSTEVICLNQNYRSDERILQLCNELFSKIMTSEFGGLDYAKDGMFDSARGNIGFAPELCIVMDKEKKSTVLPPVYSVRAHREEEQGSLIEAEQSLIVHRISQILQSFIGEGENRRQATPADIVILLRSGGDYLSLLKEKLTRIGIEVSVGEKLGFVSEQATAVLIRYLQLINNFNDDIALLTVMRSVFGGFSDQELADIKKECKYSDRFYKAAQSYIKPPKNIRNQDDANDDAFRQELEELSTEAQQKTREKLQRFFDKLEEYHLLSLYLPADRLLGRIVSDIDYFKHVFCGREGKGKAEILEAFLKFAEQSPQKKNLSEFLAHLDMGAKSEAALAKPNAVRIMTVHSSKGLEFPFVILGNMGKRFNSSDATDKIILDKDYGVVLKAFDEQERIIEKSPSWLILSQKLGKTMLEEELRILYVALTRAEYGLYIYASLDEDDKSYKLYKTDPRLVDFVSAKSYVTWLLPIVDKYAKFYKISDCKQALAQKQIADQIPHFVKDDQALTQKIAQKIQFCYPYPHLERKTFVTAAAKTDPNQDITIPILFGQENDESAAFAFENQYHGSQIYEQAAQQPHNASEKYGQGKYAGVGDSARERGTAFHKAMELLDFSADINEQIGKLDSKVAALVDAKQIEAAIKTINSLTKQGKIYKELPFILSCSPSQLFSISTQEQGKNAEGILTSEKTDSSNALHNAANKIKTKEQEMNGEKILIQGVIDLLILEEDGATIVDYKATKAQAILTAEYKKQLQIYAKAVTEILKIPVKNAYLYSYTDQTLVALESKY